MTGETVTEVLVPAGRHASTSREDLHSELDALLDAADADGGRLDGPAFWGFVAELARGRGIADGIGAAAAQHIADAGGLPEIPQDDPAGATDAGFGAARMWQWAMLAALLRHVATLPGEIVPPEFKASMFVAAADNILTGRGEMGKGPHVDLLGLGTQKGAEWKAEARAAKRLLVGAVHFKAEQTGQSAAKVRADMLPDLPDRTWKDWTREVAKAKRVRVEKVGEDARAAARLEADPTPYNLNAADVARLSKVAARGL